MAYAALISLEQTINHILNHDTYSFSPHQNQQIISINKNVSFLRVFLEDFPEKANSFEGRMRDVAHQAEDTIEYFMQRTIHHRLVNCTEEVKFKLELKEAAIQIDSVAGEASDRIKELPLHDDCDGSPTVAASTSKLAPSHKNDAMVGFDDDLLAIKEQLCGDSPKRRIIPIVGMGGIGKTTLARNTYADPLIIEHFQIRAWFVVSQNYSEKEILLSLLDSMKEFNTKRSDQSNKERVYKILKGRRYLIVMDDIWSTKAWDDLRMIFPDDHNGSRIILTTRLTDVAAYADSTSNFHQMHLIDAHQSWNLLQQKAFKEELCPPELESIGKEIARSCRGLPLAIVVVAGLLSTVSKTPAEWEKIAENVYSTIATKDEQIEKIFSLSYTHLPHHLRPCFLYMGAFPEDYVIHVPKLSKLWVAEGFLKPSESKTLEEMAEEYLEDLVKRNLVLVRRRKRHNRKIKSCTLHDVVWELCIRKAEQEKFMLHVMDIRVHGENIKDQRHVSIEQSDLNCLANIYGSTIRTLICFLSTKSSAMCLEFFTLLRVFDLVNTLDDEDNIWLPNRFFWLFHLRYLAFSNPVTIPTSISKLQNLQTLIIHPRTKMSYRPCSISLPLEIWKMPQLRHLVCYQFDELPNPEEGATCVLESLQTLSAVTNLICTESIMRKIPNIKKLGIAYSCIKYCKDYQLENLVHLQELEKLNIDVTPFYSIWRNKVDRTTALSTLRNRWSNRRLPVHQHQLEKLILTDDGNYSSFSMKNINPSTFPRTLKKLSLSGWGVPWEDMMKIVGSLPNLQVLKLRDSPRKWKQWVTSEREFPQLKYLLIEDSYLEQWISESSHFPSLKCLLLHRCYFLIEISDGIGEISTLELIEVKYSSKSLAESAKRIQEEQQSYGNNDLQVHVYGLP